DGRPATVTPNTTSSRPVIRPSKIAQAVCMNVLTVKPYLRACRLSAVVCVSLSATVIRSGATGLRARSGGATRVAWSNPAKAARPQPPPPPRPPSRAILRRDPSKITAIRLHPRQNRTTPFVPIEGEQSPHKYRQPPSTHQQVMVREHEPMLIRRKTDQHKAHQGCTAEVKVLRAILRQQIRQPVRPARFIQQ